jgi:hypothetical protein
MGADEDIGRVDGVERVEEPNATASFVLPASLVAEAQAVASRRRTSLSDVLTTAWAIGRAPLFVREAGRPDVSRVPPIVLGEGQTECAVAFARETIGELEAMLMAFDRPMSWLLREAYLLARPRLLRPSS